MTAPDRAAEARALIERYMDRFNNSDFEGALDCYYLPFTWFFDAVPFSVTTPERFMSAMTATKAKLASDGLGRTVVTGCDVRLLGVHAALAEVRVSRRRADDTELEATGGTYLLHDRGQGWRFAAFVGHPPSQTAAGIET